ncbi:MAG TPA: response regulator [Chloroflexia bacterium]|nr:response regulator [Chloroflexia bacterium]
MKDKSVLICEDDEGIIDVAQIVLEEMGYTVIVQNDSTNIFARIEEVQPHLILLDLWMPGLSGAEITRRLKADARTQFIPIIIMSANRDTARIAQEAGADAFLAKPFDISALEEVVASHLRAT